MQQRVTTLICCNFFACALVLASSARANTSSALAGSSSIDSVTGPLADSPTPVQKADPLPKASVAELIEVLRAKKDGAIPRSKAAEAVGKVGTSAIPDVFRELRKDGESWRSWAALALTEMGPPAVTPLTDGLQDKADWVRWSSATALGQLGAVARKALPELGRLKNGDSNNATRAAAALAISRINRR